MNFRVAIHDVTEGIKNNQFWMTFGMNDIKAKYRRSRLGQWWITLSVAMFIFVIGSLYGGMFHTDDNTYMAYLAVGYVLWLFIQESVNTGVMAIANAKPFMMQKSWPASLFILRTIYRDLLAMLHHAILIPPIFLWLGIWPGLTGLILAALGLALTVITTFFTVLLLAIISSRYRDFPPIVHSMMRLGFFATPIIWVERNLGEFGEWINLSNPFAYFVRIVRDPLLGLGVDGNDWLVALAIMLFTALVTLCVLARTKNQLSYWL